MIDSWKLDDIFTVDEWSIVTAALEELMCADRWDEFNYDTAKSLCRYFVIRDIK